MDAEVDFYNYKQALAGLVRHFDYAVISAPCSIDFIVNHLLAEGDATSFEAAKQGIILVHKAHPQIVVMENEGSLGYFFLFMYQTPLTEVASLVFSDKAPAEKRGVLEVEPIVLPQPKTVVASRPKKKKSKKKPTANGAVATMTLGTAIANAPAVANAAVAAAAAAASAIAPAPAPAPATGIDAVLQSQQQRPTLANSCMPDGEPHIISNNIDSLRELANDILGKQSSQLSNNITWILKMLQEPTALEQWALNDLIEKLAAYKGITEICDSNSWAKCLDTRKGKCAHKIHFEEVIESHTDVSLGDCAYLDSCFKGKMCRYVHYSIRFPKNTTPSPNNANGKPNATTNQANVNAPAISPSQTLNADILKLNLKLLGNDFKALIIDPPWEIHTNPGPGNGCSDENIANLDIGSLQTSGVVFLWVTGRVLEFGRKCLETWGYTHIEEMIWLKTNQLCRTICTGRTGHWLNHTKEHILVGMKGANATLGLQLDTDVLVSHALGKSQKPTELYAIIDRLVGPHAKKLELFGRASNRRHGWLTVGNEMHCSRIHEQELKQRLGL